MPRPSGFLPRRFRRSGQAMTEVVLLFPLFLLILFMTAKIFALLVLVQKLEIASFYAARRWQLESHLNANYAGWDTSTLQPSIEKYVKTYIGFDDPAVVKFLGLSKLNLKVDRTQVWNIVTLTVTTKAAGVQLLCKYPKQDVCADYGAVCMTGHDFICQGGRDMAVTKYVPSRDRPIQFELPGLN